MNSYLQEEQAKRQAERQEQRRREEKEQEEKRRKRDKERQEQQEQERKRRQKQREEDEKAARERAKRREEAYQKDRWSAIKILTTLIILKAWMPDLVNVACLQLPCLWLVLGVLCVQLYRALQRKGADINIQMDILIWKPLQ